MPIENISNFNEALAIIERQSDAEIQHRHLEAVVELVEAREAQILTMRNLLKEARTPIQTLLRRPALATANRRRQALLNRINNFLATTWPEKDLVA